MRPPDPAGRGAPGDGLRGDEGRYALGELFAWLDRHVNLEAIESGRAGRSAAPTLERIRALTAAMGDPQQSYPVVHVTGTNGKGSTTRLCAELLTEQGLSVGSYTSPHLERLNERICYGNEPISDRDLAGLLQAMREIERFALSRRRLEDAPTWFELVTAAALRYFSDVAVDVAVIEVGLGGRYDATNVADAAVAVLTNVELDHTEILGETRAEIAAEKAGIVKAGSVVCCGEDDPELAEIVLAEARAVGAEAVWMRHVDFSCDANCVAHGGRLLDLRTPGASYEEVYLPLHGAHQGDNAAIALAAAQALFGAPLEREVVEAAFGRARVPGRLEVIARRPLVVLDGAHNRAGAEALAEAVDEDFAGIEQVELVIGCLRGREPAGLLAALGELPVAAVHACRPPSPRALAPELVAGAASELGWQSEVHEGVDDAVEAALASAGPADLVLVTGSLYILAPARRAVRRLSSAAS